MDLTSHLGHGLRKVVDNEVGPGPFVGHVAADGGLAGGRGLPAHHVHPVLHHPGVFVVIRVALDFWREIFLKNIRGFPFLVLCGVVSGCAVQVLSTNLEKNVGDGDQLRLKIR
jgi:hypothetical protein